MSAHSIASRLRNKVYLSNNNSKKVKTSNKLIKNEFNTTYVSNVTINDLNDDVFEILLSYLPIVEKIRCESVSKRWQQLISDSLRRQTAIGMKNIGYSRSDCSLNGRHSVKEDLIDRAVFVFDNSLDVSQDLSDLRTAVQREDNQCYHNLKSLFTKCPKLLSIDLRSIELNERLVDLMADMCPKLECLHLNSMVVTNGVWSSLTNRLSDRLLHLTIRNSIKSDQESIVEDLIKCCLKLKSLKLTEWTPEVNGKWFNCISDSVTEVHIACTSAKSLFKDLNKKNSFNIKILKLSTFDALPQSVINSIGLNFQNLIQINLRNCEGFSKRSLQPIACLEQLQELRMDLPFANCDEDFSLLCQRCTQIKSIELNFGLLTLNSLELMTNHWPQLECISFRFVTIEKLNFEALILLKSFPKLRKLTLHGTNICDHICQLIQSSQSLRYLNLDLCSHISKIVVNDFIISSKQCRNQLFELSVKETKINKLKNIKNSVIINEDTIRLNNLFIYYTSEDI